MKHKKAFIIWIFSIFLAFIIYYFNREYFNNDLWIDISNNYYLLVLVYILLSILRWVFLLPVTPLLIVWVIFLQPLGYFIISVFWIVLGAMLIYYFSDFFWFHKYFSHTKYKKPIKKAKKYLSWNYWYFIFASWTVIPVVPNVVISYVWSVLKVPIRIYFFWTLTWATLETLFYIVFRDLLV
jgi:uncharacterized membrane protein YdjX (TVP38/TMEM64 family)